MNQLKAVIFDMDGVIFDSEKLYLECCKEAAEKSGIENIEETCLSCIGLNTERTLTLFRDRYGDDFPLDEFWSYARKRFAEKAQGGLLPVKKGAEELLRYLKNNHVPIGLASSTKTETVRTELTAAGLIHYFDVIIGGDMVPKSKPEPDIFLLAADWLGFPAEDCVIIEDSFNGIRAANASGAFVIMVPDLVQPTAEISSLANQILPSLIEVKKYFAEL
ncbi:MAG: HAD family phosphatase [Clostridia bacterium]|nr:HAD family phosphatase [Clostridia bacterium]